MRKKHRRPNTIHYNLLLRAIRDCAVGSEEHIRELLLPQNQSVSRKKVRFSRVLERKRPVSKKSLHVSSDSRLSLPVTSAFCFKFSQLRCFFPVSPAARRLSFSSHLNMFREITKHLFYCGSPCLINRAAWEGDDGNSTDSMVILTGIEAEFMWFHGDGRSPTRMETSVVRLWQG